MLKVSDTLDNIDQVTRREFIYIDLPYSGHADIADMGLESEATQQKREAAERKNPALKAARAKEISKRKGRAAKLTPALNADLERRSRKRFYLTNSISLILISPCTMWFSSFTVFATKATGPTKSPLA